MLWGRNDQAVTANSTTTKETSTGAPIGTYALVKGDQVNRVNGANAHFGNTSSGSRASVDVNMFGNTTMGAFIPNLAVGVFGVDAAEATATAGPLAETYVTSAGSGYGANAVVTITYAGATNATAVNATAGSTGANVGRITTLKIAQAGTNTYITNPTLEVDPPAAINITANTDGFSNTTNTLAVTGANSIWQVGDRLFYSVPAGNTAIAGLTADTYYYVSFANTTKIALSATLGGANVDITDDRTDDPAEVHTIQGDTASGYVVVGGTRGKSVAHAGWVVRREGSGGRAGRVQYETLVAMGSLGAQSAPFGTAAAVPDASDDTQLPDA